MGRRGIAAYPYFRRSYAGNRFILGRTGDNFHRAGSDLAVGYTGMRAKRVS